MHTDVNMKELYTVQKMYDPENRDILITTHIVMPANICIFLTFVKVR